MNINCQEYDFGIESLLSRCNKPFHFCSKDTHMRFLLAMFTLYRIVKWSVPKTDPVQ